MAHGMTCWIAMKFAEKHPRLVRKMILISPVMKIFLNVSCEMPLATRSGRKGLFAATIGKTASFATATQ